MKSAHKRIIVAALAFIALTATNASAQNWGSTTQSPSLPETRPRRVLNPVETRTKENTLLVEVLCAGMKNPSAGTAFYIGYPQNGRRFVQSVLHLVDQRYVGHPDPTCKVSVDGLPAQIEFFSKRDKDLLLLSVKMNTKEPGLAIQSIARLGEGVFVVGNPLRVHGVLTKGKIVDAFPEFITHNGSGYFDLKYYPQPLSVITTGVIMVDASVDHGSSGSPISSSQDGAVVGIISTINGHSVTGAEILQFLDQARKYREKGKRAQALAIQKRSAHHVRANHRRR